MYGGLRPMTTENRRFVSKRIGIKHGHPFKGRVHLYGYETLSGLQ